jgi:outer membrane receptor protein involved in Fe transport
MFMPSKSVKTTLPVTEDLYYLNKSNLGIGGNYINSNFNFEQKFNDKGHKLSVGFIYSSWDGKVRSDIEIDTTDMSWTDIFSSTRYRTLQHDLENEYRVKLDYTWPLNEKSSIEAGYQGRIKTVATEYNKENYLPGIDSWSNDSFFNNGMDFKQNIQSLYFTLSGSLLGIDAKAGLRTEYADRTIDVVADNEHYSLELVDLFPTLHLSKKFGEKRELQASYSRRINRPDEWNLNPFPIYSDNDITQSGNPNLKPEYVDSYELNFMQHLKKGFTSFEAYYRQTNNAIQQTLILNEETGIIKISPDNLSMNFAYGVEISTNLNLAKWFSVYASANLYSFNVRGDIVSSDIETNSLNSDFVLNSNFNIKKSTRIQLTGFYNAPKVTAQGKQSEMYGVNMAVRQDLMKKKLVVSLRVNDVFQTMKFKFNAETPGVKTNFTFKMDSPTLMLSLAYTINNYKKRADDEGLQQNIGGGIL